MAKESSFVCGWNPWRRQLLLPTVFVLVVWIVPTQTDRNCPPIVPGEGSPLFPQRTKGGNVTMYRVFHTLGNPPRVNITWVREPSGLSLSNGRYQIKNSLSKGTIRASITVWDLMLFPDVGSYTVTVCSNCTCNKTTFVLQLFKCDPTALPEPVTQYENINITDSFSKVLYLYSIFNGSTNTFFYNTDWTHDGKDLCFEGATKQSSALFTCNRTILGDCLFSANLYINGYTIKNSGNYTVQAIGGGSASRNSTIHVDISREKRTNLCSPGQLTRDYKGNSIFTCHNISNYSDYVQVVVVEDNRIEYNESTRDLSFGCEAHAQDRSQATCTVGISSSLHSGKRDYQLCAGYNFTTSQLHCSDRITVIPGNSQRVALGVLAEVTLIVLLVAVLMVLYIRVTAVGPREDRTKAPSEDFGLFKQGGAFHAVQKERVNCKGDHMEGRVPGSSPKLAECDHGSVGTRVNSPKTASAPNANIRHTELWGEVTGGGGVIGRDEWGHNAGGIDPRMEAHFSEAAALAIRQSYRAKFQLAT